MVFFITKRLLYGLLVMWGVATVVFLFQVLPADPARMMLDQREDADLLKNIRVKYGFDRPITEQYFLYINDLLPLSFHHLHFDAYTHIKKYKSKRVVYNRSISTCY